MSRLHRNPAVANASGVRILIGIPAGPVATIIEGAGPLPQGIPMSSGTVTPLSPPPETPVAPPTECEVVIERRLAEDRRNVKGVDIAGGLITLAIGVLAYLLAGRGDRSLADRRRVGFLGAAVAVAGAGGRGGNVFRAPVAAAAAASHQSAVRGRHDRAEPAVAEEQPDQFSAASRPASGGRPDRLPGDGAPRRGRPGRRGDRRGGRSHARHPPGLRVGRRCWPCSACTWSSRRRVRSARPRGSCGRGRASKRPRA